MVASLGPGSITAVITAAPRKALTTVARLRMLYPYEDMSDAPLEMLIQQASRQIEGYCGRTFARERVIEVFDSDGPTSCHLSRTPVVELFEVAIDGEALDLSTMVLVDAMSGLIRCQRPPTFEELLGALPYSGGDLSYGWGSDVRTLVRFGVEYTGGWQPQGWPTGTADLPEDLEMACMQLVTVLEDRRSRPMSVRSETLGDFSRSYGGGGSGGVSVASASWGGMPAEIESILAPYRRLIP